MLGADDEYRQKKHIPLPHACYPRGSVSLAQQLARAHRPQPRLCRCLCCVVYQADTYDQMTPSWWPRHVLSATSFALLLSLWFGRALAFSTSNHHSRPVGIDRGRDRFSDHDDLPVPTVFKKDFTRPLDIPEEGLQAAMEVLRSGRLFRYSAEAAELSQVQKIGALCVYSSR